MLSDIIYDWGGSSVTPMELYTDMFRLGDGELQYKDEPSGEFKANPVAYWKNNDQEKGHFRILFEDTFEEVLQELQQADFAILNGITYFGRRNVQSHASKMYAMIFDLDEVSDLHLNAFLSGAIMGDAYPIPNYIVLSGHGVHLYYILERPVPLYPNIKLQLKDLKYALTEKIWNEYTSPVKKKQHQGINQGFRVAGGKTKDDAPIPRTMAYRVNEHPFNLDQLSSYVPKEFRVDESKIWKETKYTLAQAKKKFPEWFEKVIVQGDKTPKLWDIKGKVHGDNPYALYDWWKELILEGASYHHRYFAIMCLAIYGIKNEKPYEEVEKDAYELMPFLNSINPDAPFEEEDVESALECYDYKYAKFPIKDLEKISGIPIPRNKRNYQKQADHLEEARAIRDIRMKRQGRKWDDDNGRPKGSGTAESKVAAYRAEHPEASVTEVARALELSRTTVYKWWSSQMPKEPKEPTVYRFTPTGVEEVSISALGPYGPSEVKKEFLLKKLRKKP